MKKNIFIILVTSLISLNVMGQNETTNHEESSFSTKNSFSSSINKFQHSKVLNYLSSKLGSSDSKKRNYIYWIDQSNKNESYEIRLYKNKIKIKYKSKVSKSSSEKSINELILGITDILHG